MKLRMKTPIEETSRIEYTGLRPGEKLYEELLIGESVTGTEHPKILRAEEETLSWERLREPAQQDGPCL